MNEFDRLKIRLALEDLNAAFVHHLDREEVEPLVDLFTADALYVHGPRRSEGREAIRAVFAARTAMGPRTSRHLYSGLRIVIRDASAAAGRCVCVAFAASAAPPVADTTPHLVADFIDDYACGADGRWRIACREIRRIFVAPTNTGPVGALRDPP